MRLGVGPEPIIPAVVMDSGLAQERARDAQLRTRNDG
jgi:hypothetical protein